jgi:hypothetical protein
MLSMISVRPSAPSKPDAGGICNYETSSDIQPKAVDLDLTLEQLVLSGFWMVAIESPPQRIDPVKSGSGLSPNRALTAISYNLNHDVGVQ